jgi:hypothetical protein
VTDLGEAAFAWLLQSWGPAVDLRLALDADAVQFVGPEENREKAIAATV